MITQEAQAEHVDELLALTRLMGFDRSDIRFVLRLDVARIPRWLRARRVPHRGLLRRMLIAVRNALVEPRPEPRYLPAAIARRLPRIDPEVSPRVVPARPLLSGPSADIPAPPMPDSRRCSGREEWQRRCRSVASPSRSHRP